MRAKKIRPVLYVTESRVVLACDQYEKGEIFLGEPGECGNAGALGVVAAAVGSVDSKIRTKIETKDTILAGQIRHQWLQAVCAERGVLGGERLLLACRIRSGGEGWRTYILKVTLGGHHSALGAAEDIARGSAAFKLRWCDRISGPSALALMAMSKAGQTLKPLERGGRTVYEFPYYQAVEDGTQQ